MDDVSLIPAGLTLAKFAKGIVITASVISVIHVLIHERG